jgi:hypothetical protein
MSLTRFERLARSVAYTPGDKLVFADPFGDFKCCPADGARAYALFNSSIPHYRIIGVFSPGVSAATLATECSNA